MKVTYASSWIPHSTKINWYYKTICSILHMNQVHNHQTKKPSKISKKLVTNHKECLMNNEFNYVTEYEWKSSIFYIQPKINKCTKLREIISNSNSDYVKTPPPPPPHPHTLKGRSIIAGPCSPRKYFNSPDRQNQSTISSSTNIIYKRRLAFHTEVTNHAA